MEQELLFRIIKGEKPTEEDIKNALYDICDRVHASCNNECPVYELNGGKVPDTANDFNINRGCDCFKSGTAMLNFIKERI